jgi:hypothetical protein
MSDDMPSLFSNRKAPLLSHFKSIYACLGPGPRPAIDILETWLLAFMRWYGREMSDAAAQGVFPNHFFGPSVTVMGPASVQYAPAVSACFSRCRDVGLSPQVSINLQDAFAQPAAIRTLADAGLAQLDLHLTAPLSDPDARDAVDLVQPLLSAGVRLRLFGTSWDWLATGILDLEDVNARFISIYPMAERKTVMNSARACGPRFGIWIDPEGCIYPCAGLMGVAEFRLGDIRVDRSEDDAPPFDMSAVAALADLAEAGPDLPRNVSGEAASRGKRLGLPVICRQHRAALGLVTELV